jgi:hypothetical protein
MWRTDTSDAIARAAGGQRLIQVVRQLCLEACSNHRRARAWWTPLQVVLAWVFMSWQRGGGLLERFEAARPLLGQAKRCRTYQGLVKASGVLACWGLWPALMKSLRERIDQEVGTLALRPISIDGSKFELPRTQAHQRTWMLSKRKRRDSNKPGRSNHEAPAAPQAWAVLLWDMTLGLIYACRIGGKGSSEPALLRSMIPLLPANALAVMDAGFASYGLIDQITASGRHVLVRAGRNLSLIRKLFADQKVAIECQRVWLWPKYAQKRRQKPLALRLIRVDLAKGRRMYLLTSVLDAKLLPWAQAASLYRRRWGIELCYRTLKQTLEKRKLQARAPTQACQELIGLIAGLAILGFLTCKQVRKAGGQVWKWSAAAAFKIARRLLARGGSWSALSKALIDDYVRGRKTRCRWPRQKQIDKPPGRPHLRQATASQIRLAAQLIA